ncbi:MAG: nucleotide exchange factor GrpE [Nitrospinota bacterium]|nr:nucleotide exchange factor GrpE [Nitrospinota bacterium]
MTRKNPPGGAGGKKGGPAEFLDEPLTGGAEKEMGFSDGEFTAPYQTPMEKKELPRRRDEQIASLEDRIARLTEELQEREIELVEARDSSLRAVAEADNYKKRLEREREERLRRDEANLVVSFIPVLDTLDKALEQAAGDWPGAEKFREGIELTRQQFHDILAKKGLERFITVGQQFNPETSEALAVEDTSEFEDGVVIREFAAGYMMRGALVRTARVIVARNASGKEKNTGDEEGSG